MLGQLSGLVVFGDVLLKRRMRMMKVLIEMIKILITWGREQYYAQLFLTFVPTGLAVCGDAWIMDCKIHHPQGHDYCRDFSEAGGR